MRVTDSSSINGEWFLQLVSFIETVKGFSIAFGQEPGCTVTSHWDSKKFLTVSESLSVSVPETQSRNRQNYLGCYLKLFKFSSIVKYRVYTGFKSIIFFNKHIIFNILINHLKQSCKICPCWNLAHFLYARKKVKCLRFALWQEEEAEMRLISRSLVMQWAERKRFLLRRCR